MNPEPLLLNDRDKRAWEWICSKVGEGNAIAAIGQLSGSRKPYPSNIAKILGLEVPKDVAFPVLSKEDGLDRVRKLRKQLGL